MPNPVGGLLDLYGHGRGLAGDEDISQRFCRLKICSVVLLPALKPACTSAIIFYAGGFSLFSMIFSMTLVTDEADRSVVLALLQVAILRKCDD